MKAVYGPASDRRVSVEYDFPLLAGDRKFMNTALMGMGNQRLMQQNRLDTPRRAQELCDEAGRAGSLARSRSPAYIQ